LYFVGSTEKTGQSQSEILSVGVIFDALSNGALKNNEKSVRQGFLADF
jgi:hypothetical protein